MARATIKSDETDTDSAAERMAELNEAEGGDLFRAIEEARSTQGAEVILTRTMPADKAGFCDKIPVAEFDLTLLKSKYGPGTYRVRFNGPTGFLPGGSTIKIAATPEKPAASATDPLTFFEMMERKEAERRARTDDWLKVAVPAVVGLITAFISRPQSNDIAQLVTALKPAPGPTLADLSGTLLNMKTLAAPEKNESQVDTILKVFEAAQNLMGGDSDKGGKGGSNWTDIIRDLIKAAPEALKPVLEARMAAMQPRPTVQQIQPAIAPNPNAPLQTRATPQATGTTPTSENASAVSATNQGNDMRALWEPIAKQHLAKVLAWAEKDRAPEVYAEVFIDELPDLSPYLSVDQVLEHLKNEKWFEKVCELEPRLKDHVDYCNEFHDAVVSIVEQLRKDAADETPNPPIEGHQES